MSTIAALRDALAAAASTTRDDYTLAPRATEPFPILPPATAPCGPRAARTVAQQLADAGHHSHLNVDGTSVCLNRLCPPPDTLAGVTT